MRRKVGGPGDWFLKVPDSTLHASPVVRATEASAPGLVRPKGLQGNAACAEITRRRVRAFVVLVV